MIINQNKLIPWISLVLFCWQLVEWVFNFLNVGWYTTFLGEMKLFGSKKSFFIYFFIIMVPGDRIPCWKCLPLSSFLMTFSYCLMVMTFVVAKGNKSYTKKKHCRWISSLTFKQLKWYFFMWYLAPAAFSDDSFLLRCEWIMISEYNYSSTVLMLTQVKFIWILASVLLSWWLLEPQASPTFFKISLYAQIMF